MRNSLLETTTAKTIFGASLLVLALFSGAPAKASVDATSESLLRTAIATAGTLGTGAYSCGYEMMTPPIEIAPAPGKFQYSALSLALKTPFSVEGPTGYTRHQNIKIIFVEEPRFERFAVSDASENLKATFNAMIEGMKPVKLEIVMDADGKLVRITGFHEVSFLDGKPAQLRSLFGCN